MQLAFDEEAIKVNTKSLQEINRLRQTYRSDLPVYSVPCETNAHLKHARETSVLVWVVTFQVQRKKIKLGRINV